MSAVEFDPYSHRWKQDPYSKYRELRDEAPIHHAEASDAWCVSRYEDVTALLKAPEVFSSKVDRDRESIAEGKGPVARVVQLVRFMVRMKASPWAMGRSRMLIREDGEVHAAMRNIVNRGFTPRRVSAWEKRVRELADEGLARMREHGSFDLVQDLAIPLPVTVIAEMLGVESERLRDFKRWSDAIIEGGTGSGMGSDRRVLDAMAELRSDLRPLGAARRDRPAEDLISTLVTAEGEAALSDFEVYLFVLLLLVAGNETTTNLLGNAVDALLAHPEQLARLAGDPELVPGLVEETLRWDTPVQFVTRQTLREVELRGTRIPAGAHVVALLASANRDERRFPDPDRFDVTRDTRGHVGFGFGAHFCLGASLARLEAKAALQALVPELPGLARVRPEPEFLDSYIIRGRTRLELRPAA